jgi:hypothetical protein
MTREMQHKTPRTHHLIPVSMAIVKQTKKNAGEDTEKRTLYIVDRNVS